MADRDACAPAPDAESAKRPVTFDYDPDEVLPNVVLIPFEGEVETW